MSLKSLYPQSILMPVFVLLLFLITGKTHAQCAGTDAVIEICDYANPANQSIDLFALLGPDAVPGGFWIDPLQTGALNILTGEFSLWSFHFTGTFTFTYIRSNIPGCVDNNATVTVTIGGYTGIPSPDGTACTTNDHVNLFQYFIGADPYPQHNGTWTSPDGVTIVESKYFSAAATGPGVFTFVYTADAIGSCPEVTSTVIVTVYEAPDAGEDTKFVVCEADDLSQYNNYNLAELLQGEDSNGIWSESGTAELSDPFDPIIDIEHLYQTYGSGIYTFTYTVFPQHPVCDKQMSEIKIYIEDRIDLTNGTLTFEDFCGEAGGPFHATLTQGPDPITNSDQYEIDYHVEGAGISADYTQEIEFIGGISHFDIVPTGIGGIGVYTITITDIRKLDSFQSCDNIAGISGTINVYSIPAIDDAIINIPTVCKGSDGIVQLTAMDIPDGAYEITYSIFASNKIFNQHVVINVLNGAAQVNIPAAVIPNTGNSTFYITHIVSLKTGCEANVDKFKTFVIYDLPFIDNITLQANSGCLSVGTTVLVTDLGPMTTIKVTYDISGVNTAVAQEATFTAVLGNGTFTIPPALLPNSGMTTITLTNVQDLITGCSSPTNISDEFMMNILPDTALLNAEIAAVCHGTAVTAIISGMGNQSNLVLKYSLSGANNAAVQTVNLTDTGNTAFIIPAGLIPNAGLTTFTIVSITNTLTGCIAPLNTPVIFTIHPVPPVNTFSAVIQNVCLGQPVNALLSGFGNIPNMDITYSLSGANTATAQTASLTITNGSGVFNIPAALLPNSGNTIFSISQAVYPDTGCIAAVVFSQNFTINPLPDVTTLAIQATDVCFGNAVSVNLSGLAGNNPTVVSYTLSGANSATTAVTVTPFDGNAAFVIPSGSIPNTGETVLTINSITNQQTTCVSAATANDSFSINPIPAAPVAANMVFCVEENAVVADLLPSGNQFLWYASADAIAPLDSGTMVNNGNYFVSEASNAGCYSPRTQIAVTITELPPLVLNTDGELFCGADQPTLLNLTANVTATGAVLWYDAVQNGNLLDNDTPLQEGATYYGVQYSDDLGCTSQELLAVTVSLTDCSENPTEYDFFIPDGFSPNGDGINDTFRIPDIEFLYPDYTYEIYNRYGSVLFKGNINKPAWDGTNTESGGEKIVPNGVYFYVIKFNKNSATSKQGRLYLNR